MRGPARPGPVFRCLASIPFRRWASACAARPAARARSLRQLHVQGPGANAIGPGNLRSLAEVVMERLDFDALEIEGALRTTGASPGRRPRPLRFTRRPRAPGT
jgi:hypothetical protein